MPAGGPLVLKGKGHSLALRLRGSTKGTRARRGGKTLPQALFEDYFLRQRPVPVRQLAREYGISKSPVKRLMAEIEAAAATHPRLGGVSFARQPPGGASPVMSRKSKASRLTLQQRSAIERAAAELLKARPRATQKEIREACFAGLRSAGLPTRNLTLTEATLNRLKKRVGFPVRAIASRQDIALASEIMGRYAARGIVPTNKMIRREFARRAAGEKGGKTPPLSDSALKRIREKHGIARHTMNRKQAEVIATAFRELVKKSEKSAQALTDRQISKHCVLALKKAGLGKGITEIPPMTIYRMKKKAGLVKSQSRQRPKN
jgi:hypothetical protein